jgi:benzoate membrane transport protein
LNTGQRYKSSQYPWVLLLCCALPSSQNRLVSLSPPIYGQVLNSPRYSSVFRDKPAKMKFLLKDFSVSAATAGLVAVLVGVTSTIALVFQAAHAFGATEAQVASWIWALGVGMGVCCIIPSLVLRKPVMVAWSTPGAAVLIVAASGGQFNLQLAVGAFILSAIAVVICGVTGWFERVMNRIPMALANALLAGLLARFGMNAFGALATDFGLVMTMFVTYLVGARLWPRYAVPTVLFVGFATAWWLGGLQEVNLSWQLTHPQWVWPQFSWGALMSMAVPLFIVTMASQNLPGVAAIQSAGYQMPISKLITMTGGVTLLLAPVGAYALSLSAITASICMSPQSHEDPQRRYVASTVCGVLYLLIGLFGAAVVSVLNSFPTVLIVAIAGFALLGTIGNGLSTALQDVHYREPALITFLVTLSGLTLLGIGSAFWGVLAGILSLVVHRWRRR